MTDDTHTERVQILTVVWAKGKTIFPGGALVIMCISADRPLAWICMMLRSGEGGWQGGGQRAGAGAEQRGQGARCGGQQGGDTAGQGAGPRQAAEGLSGARNRGTWYRRRGVTRRRPRVEIDIGGKTKKEAGGRGWPREMVGVRGLLRRGRLSGVMLNRTIGEELGCGGFVGCCHNRGEGWSEGKSGRRAGERAACSL